MKPIGLTMKPGRNKYRLGQRGELMLVHECIECKSLSINRIAADDDPEAILVVFQASTENQIHRVCQSRGILILESNDSDILYKQLYGCLEIPVKVW
jgi:hypothetical protein